MDHKAINQARVLYYTFFAKVLDFPEKENVYQELMALLSVFDTNPLDEVTQEAFKAIRERFETQGLALLKQEYNDVFVSPESSFIPLSASYYDEGRDDGQKRVEASGILLRSQFRKNKPLCNDAEDQILFLFRLMRRLIDANDEESLALSRELFSSILNDCIDEFTGHLFDHEKSVVYKQTAVILKAFIAFERLYLDVAPSTKVASAGRVSAVIQQDRKPLTQRVKRNLDEIVL